MSQQESDNLDIEEASPRKLVHEPLKDTDKQIRLATIHPGEGDDPIECTLDAYDVGNCPPYEALSYYWGRNPKYESIVLQGSNWQVTRNLYLALKHLRHPTFKRILWIDAICIRQLDNSEKSLQIPLMGRIYGRASAVIAWIGVEKEHTAMAFEGIRRFTRIVHQLEDPDHQSTALNEFREFSANYVFWAEVYEISRLKYWTRLWVFQELLLAEYIIIQCGKCTISDGRIYQFMICIRTIQLNDFIGYCPPTIRDSLAGDLDAIFLSGLAELIVFAGTFRESVLRLLSTSTNEVQKSHYYSSFYYLLLRTHSAGCLNPRDHIYALLGLTAYHPVDSSLKVIPDYQQPVFKVFKDFTWTYISGTGTLSMLEKAGDYRRRRDDIKLSWVPDFTYNDTDTRHNIRWRQSGACGQWTDSFHVNDLEELVTPALLCDQIDSQIFVCVESDLRDFELCRNLIGFISEKMETVNRRFTLSETLIVILVLDHDPWENSDMSYLERILGCILWLGDFQANTLENSLPQTYDSDNYVDCFYLWVKGSESFVTATEDEKQKTVDQELPYLSTIFNWPEADSLDVTGYRRNFLDMNPFIEHAKLNVFCTQKGYFGYSGGKIEVGDLISVLPTATNPFVLRKESNSFKLIDYAMVHGMMFGEMAELFEKGLLSPETINIS